MRAASLRICGISSGPAAASSFRAISGDLDTFVKVTKISNTVNIENRRAKYDFQFIDTYTAGIVLKGTEIKSIREGKAGLADSYCYFRNGELYIKNLHIAEYENASFYTHEPMRERKLLLGRQELNKLV